MEESVCPECKTRIGGGNHQLLAGNALASEMDGAERPAYGAVDNMELYEEGLRVQFAGEQ